MTPDPQGVNHRAIALVAPAGSTEPALAAGALRV
jgi:hypothetical protein